MTILRDVLALSEIKKHLEEAMGYNEQNLFLPAAAPGEKTDLGHVSDVSESRNHAMEYVRNARARFCDKHQKEILQMARDAVVDDLSTIRRCVDESLGRQP